MNRILKQHLKIGIDVDEVLLQLIEPLFKYWNDNYGRLSEDQRPKRKHVYQYKFWPLWECDKATAIDIVHEYYQTEIFKKSIPVQGSVEGLEALAQDHELSIVTSRSNAIYDETLRWLNENYNYKFNDKNTHFTSSWSQEGSRLTKGKICFDQSLDYLIEDSYENAIECVNYADEDGTRSKTKVFLFTCPWNKNFDTTKHKNIIRVHSWKEITDYLLENSQPQ